MKIVTTSDYSTISPDCSTGCSHVVSSPNHHFTPLPVAPVAMTVLSAGVREHFDGEESARL